MGDSEEIICEYHFKPNSVSSRKLGAKKSENNAPIKISPQKKIDDYFKITSGKGQKPKIKVRTDIMDKNRTFNLTPPSEVKSEAASLSPGIRKRPNRFKSVSPVKATPARKKILLEVETNSPPKEVEPSVSGIGKKTTNTLAFIIQEFYRIDKLQVQSQLLTTDELAIVQQYLCLPEQAQTILQRRFFGKCKWSQIGDDLNSVGLLESKGFVRTDMAKCGTEELLNLLRKDDVARIGKKFASSAASRKENIIDAIMKSIRTQKSIMESFIQNTTSRETLVRNDVLNVLGKCYKLTDICRNALNRVILLFSLTHRIENEAKRAEEQRRMVYRILSGELKFIAYELSPTVIFENRNDFIEYESAINLRKNLELAFENKDYAQIEVIGVEAHKSFERLLIDFAFNKRNGKLPTFLQRFNAASVLASVLTQYCERFKKKQNKEIVTAILWKLIGQLQFGKRSRGKWLELLFQLYMTAAMENQAFHILEIAAQDPYLGEVDKISLQAKALRFKKKKNYKDKIDVWLANMLEEPASIEISGRVAPGNSVGSKLVYVQQTATGTRFCSVEEHAITHYMSQGFSHGCHVEGKFISNIFCIFFFDIIYSRVNGAFLSPFQDRPLDFYSSEFYENRKSQFKERLGQMSIWTEEHISQIIDDCFENYKNSSCVINWENLDAKSLAEIAICIGIPGLIALCKRFIHNPREARSGFPDLTLWNISTKKCKFVEVKSPNDTLAANQRVWLAYLRNNGIDCEVCNVRNVGAKANATSQF